ncbi:hypothetical protein AMCSP17_001990 [Streptococcus pneumoniae 2080913]|nr:hypothetical protein AMCSP17_001990 [Streptococcus pneumoniae 2080913]
MRRKYKSIALKKELANYSDKKMPRYEGSSDCHKSRENCFFGYRCELLS